MTRAVALGIVAGVAAIASAAVPTAAPTAATTAPAAVAAMFDVVIRGGRVVDGTGNPWFVADVGIRGGRIAHIGRLAGATALRTIEAGGKIVAPGFIDVHAHIEGGIEKRPTADNFVGDGVTSVVTGNCGFSKTDVAGFFAGLRTSGVSVNVATLIGHNNVREDVLGAGDRAPSADEQARMEALVDKGMRAGAMGFATGLIYTPGSYASTAEIVGLARAAGRHGGLYASHIRSEGDKVMDAIDEAIAVGRQAGVAVEISHFKVANKLLWGKSSETLARVEAARALGVDVTVDQYPYTASSTSLHVLLPGWAQDGGREALGKRLADPATRKKIAAEMKDTIGRRNGHKRLDYAVVALCKWDSSRNGKSLAVINREMGGKPGLADEIATALDMIEKGGAQMVYHSMDEKDVERILRHPFAMIASDGGVIEPGEGVPHPRAYGTNARVLGRYVRERKVIRIEEAIRKMTSLPAQRFGIAARGLLRPGSWADVVIFDEATISDAATFARPHAYAVGVEVVLVNGEAVWQSGKHTGARPGQILLGPGGPG